MGEVFLGIDTSCDDTCVALVDEGRRVLASVVSSQEDIHKKFGGILPEFASRAHAERIGWVAEEAIKKSGIGIEDIKGVGVTRGPGLPGSLLVGWEFAKGLSISRNIPLIPLNHLEAHLFACFLGREGEKFPLVGMVVSGGHTLLAYSPEPFKFYLLGQTRDDAGGEALDKVARMLGLSYPGGPELEKLAKKGDPSRIEFPLRILPGTYDFSFSGIKTQAKRIWERKEVSPEDLAASFQKAVVEILVDKLEFALDTLEVNMVVAGGGVVANRLLRERLKELSWRRNIPVWFPPPEFSIDNGAMIAGLAYYRWKEGREGGLEEDIKPSWNLELWKG